ncbi:hypothetical protein GEV33_009569 [Tenebrio molitor]|uniref:Integrase catalytic domain-containing protein n=1 Tax=Tenebrio molitor TaxID=7067 RepID=A0A8J6HF35_TENMO|nr:hypothetical protein GEV33_009569 [Tenebrio molitor]
MKSDIYRYIAGCKTCAQHKVEQKPPAGLMGNRANPSAPWEIISLDFIGPFPRSSQGYTYALVVTDHFTKFVLIFPMRTATAKTLTRYLEEQVFLVYGTPRTIVCDNGAQMNGTLFRKLCAKYQVTIHFTPRYYSRANPTERITAIGVHDLAAIGCAIRSACHETTDYSPYFANFGREYVALGSEHQHPLTPTDIRLEDEIARRKLGFQKLYRDISEKLQIATERNRQVYDLRRRPVEYQPGQQVWRKDKSLSDKSAHYVAKLGPKYVGPLTDLKPVKEPHDPG